MTEANAMVSNQVGGTKDDALLVIDGVHRAFGGLVAVDVDHLEISRGKITALIGPNGAGKTTLFNLLTKFDKPQRGHWRLDDTHLEHKTSYQVARSGMVRTFQLTKSLTRLTVMENMKLAARQRGDSMVLSLLGPVWRRQEKDIEDRAHELLVRFKLDRLSDDFAGTLSGGQRKLLEMARALMVEPKLIMLDEPMAGVNPALAETLLQHITELPERGTSVVFVEHDMNFVMQTSDWVVCMAQGRVISEGVPSYVANDPVVIDSYLGRRNRGVANGGEDA